ncbi:MAG: response regulator transcription factor [Anaerolineae bacterium]
MTGQGRRGSAGLDALARGHKRRVNAAEVIKQVARGLANQEIADRLGLSVKTVETYRARAMDKLGLANRAALVRYALEKGWLGEG